MKIHLFRSFGIAAYAMLACCFGTQLVEAADQPVSTEAPVTIHVGPPYGPATRLLAIGHWTKKATTTEVGRVIPSEVPATVRLYLDGVIDQWFIRLDDAGVVFLLNTTDRAKAESLLEALPLGRAGLMKFEFVELGPIAPLRGLLVEH